jgi:fucose permease
VYGPNVAPFMNALHCFYGVGAMISPVIVDAAGGLVAAYAALALALLPVAAWVAWIPSPSLIPSATKGESNESNDRPLAVGAFVLLFALCQSGEAGFGGWIYMVATDAGFHERAAARLLSGFWAAFTVGRVLGILAATRIDPKRMLGVDLLGSLLSLAWLVAIPGPVGLWIGTLGLGLALASVFPSALALAGRYVTLTGSVTSRIFVGASVGTTMMPWLVGRSFALGSQAPMLVLLIDLALASVVFVLIVTRLRPLASSLTTSAGSPRADDRARA